MKYCRLLATGARHVPLSSRKPSPSRRRPSMRAGGFVLASLLAVAGPAGSELVLSDQGSEIYYRLAVAAGGRIQVEKDTEITGSLHSNGSIFLKKGVVVDGDAAAVGAIKSEGTVTGTASEGADARTLPRLFDEAEMRALADRVFEGDATFTGEVVDDVVFVDGQVEVFGRLDGEGTILATGDVRLREAPDVPAESTRISLISLDDVRLDKGRHFRGALRAGRDVDLEMDVVFEGVIVADRDVHVKQASRLTFLDLDREPPAITLVSPEDGAVLDQSQPEVVIALADGFSGLDLDTLELLVDGDDVTSEAMLSEEPEGTVLVRWTPSVPLADGLHTVDVSVRDHSENAAQASFTFTIVTVQGEPPSIAVVAPRPIVIGETQPAIVVEYAAGSASLDLASLRVRLDGVDLTVGCNVGPASATCAGAELAAGLHSVEAEIHSTAGTVATDRRDFEVVVGAGPHTVDVTGAADTYLDPGAPETAFGELAGLRLGQGSRVLVRLADDALLPLGDGELVSAELRLEVTTNGGDWGAGQQVDVYRARLQPWSEAAATWSCPLAAGCEPTWDGGVFDLTATSSTFHDDTTTGEVAFDVTADVEAFLRDGENHGWLIRKRDEALPGTVEYAARESGNGPRLVLVFATPEPQDPASDTVAPSLDFTAPRVPILQDERTAELVVTYDDDGSGIDPESLLVTVDGVDVTASCVVEPSFATCSTGELPGAESSVGKHLASAEVRDLAGNPATAELEILMILGEGDVEPPAVTIASPPDGTLVNQQAIEVSGFVADDGLIAQVFVDGLGVELAGDAFTSTVFLLEGDNPIRVAAVDGTGKRTEALVHVRLDATPPELAILEPQEGFSTEAASVVVRGTVEDVNGALAGVSVQGIPVTVADGFFELDVALAEGVNLLTVEAVDTAGNVALATREVERVIPPPPAVLPQVAITAPEELSLVSSAAVTVTGTVSNGIVGVEVNGVAATLANGAFTAADVPLVSGINQLNAVAREDSGRVASATVTVIRDTDPPLLVLDEPAAGAVVFDSPITVRGLVKDLDVPAVNTPPPAVTVNGFAAEVDGTSFLLGALDLQPGDNELTVRAEDQAGNVAEVRSTVRLQAPNRGRLRVVSGHLQEGTIGTLLAQPLVVEVLDAAGQPVPGQTILFEVVGNNGFFSGSGRRQVAVTSDAQGRASVEFVLGTRAGAGSQVVEASAAGFAGPAAFTATAVAGPPAMVVVDSGAGQIGALGEILPESLVAVVVDGGKNRLPGVAVEFTVVEGDGSFENGLKSITTVSDREGRAAVRFRLGPDEGIANNVAEATVLSVPDEFAAFVASGRAAGDPAQTAVSGLVLDNTDQPVPGVTVRVDGTALTTTTDAAGRFRLDGVPVGLLDVVFDGGTVSRPGIWPTLGFMINAVAGRVNDFGRPIYLLPIDVERGLHVSESEGGTLRLPEVPGFSLEVAPGSVTFPDGSREGVVSVTLVNTNKVPMPPNFGQQPRFVITIQPAGAHFDPPARMSLPNTDALAPGTVTEMYSFDHDLFRFVSIGPATVSEDGTRVVSNPGVGVIEGGWHCGGDPSSSGTTHDCPICRTCVRDRCVPDDSQSPEQRSPRDCQRQICRDGSVTSVPNDGETPEQASIHDCQRQICRDGSVTSVDDDQETPEQTDGNCTVARCQNGRPVFLTDLNDPPPGLACCGIQLSPMPPLIYDPQTTCCLLDPRPRRVPRHPVQDLDECPGLSPYPGHVPQANGCGPQNGVDVPEAPVPGCPAFTPACNQHDLCWDVCRNSAAHKLGCDLQFLQNLQQQCLGCNNPVSFDLCQKAAELYAGAVAGAGWGAYYDAQREACQCCSN